MSRNVWAFVAGVDGSRRGGHGLLPPRREHRAAERGHGRSQSRRGGGVVDATGTLAPMDTVEVGSQVTGTSRRWAPTSTVASPQGQVLATLDPAVLQAQVDQAAATVTRLKAEVESGQGLAGRRGDQAHPRQALGREQLILAGRLDTAKMTRDAAQASVVSAQAQVAQAQRLARPGAREPRHTIIRSPADGVVLARNVEVGQTVTSGLQTPTLFVIARDLQKMQLKASVDEADIGRVLTGQPVAFTVDAHGAAHVRRARLAGAPAAGGRAERRELHDDDRRANHDLELKPGMTATVRIETARSDDALRVPAAAVRFRPTADLLQAMGHGDESTRAPRGQRRGRPQRACAARRRRRRTAARSATVVDGRLERVRGGARRRPTARSSPSPAPRLDGRHRRRHRRPGGDGRGDRVPASSLSTGAGRAAAAGPARELTMSATRRISLATMSSPPSRRCAATRCARG